MCMQDLLISRKAKIKTYTLDASASNVRIGANPDRIALYASNAIGASLQLSLQTYLDDGTLGPIVGVVGWAVGQFSLTTTSNMVALTYQSAPGIISGEMGIVAGSGVVYVVEVILDGKASKEIQEMGEGDE